MALLKKLKKQKMAVGIIGQKIVLYGDNGTGKTTVAIEIGKAICKQVSSNPDAAPLVISFENGTNASDDFYYVDGTDYKQTREILSDINNEKNRAYVLETTPVVIVDGVEETFTKVWLSPSMKGRFYGGGMMVAPAQDRMGDVLSNVVYRASNKFQALIVFPKIFKGEHVKKVKMVRIATGKEITVKFDRPCALQIDGETVLGVSEYTVKA